MNNALEAEVMGTLDRWAQALWEKNLQGLAGCYARDVRVFDIGTQLNSYDGLRCLWEASLPEFPNPIGVERKDVRITANGDLAVVTFLSRLTGMASERPAAKSWLRTTVCLQKQDRAWKIIHDHISLPVDCQAERPNYIMDSA